MISLHDLAANKGIDLWPGSNFDILEEPIVGIGEQKAVDLSLDDFSLKNIADENARLLAWNKVLEQAEKLGATKLVPIDYDREENGLKFTHTFTVKAAKKID